jgi:two-component system, LytTR family, response regulator
MTNPNSFIFPLVSGKSKFFVKKEEILYCSALGSYTNVVLKDSRKFCISKRLKSVESMLGYSNLFRIHHSFSVNTDYIKRFFKDEKGLHFVTLEDDTIVSVSRRKQKDLLKKLMLLSQ